jgi:hypothetical protein
VKQLQEQKTTAIAEANASPSTTHPDSAGLRSG